MAANLESGERSLRVLQSLRVVRETTNPYLVQLVTALEREASVQLFTWPRALLGRWDVLHIHWPELLFVREGRLRTAAGAVLCWLLLMRVRLGNRAIVRTVHNVRPHEDRGGLTERMLSRIDSATTLFISMADAGAENDVPVEVIPHGHYSDWYPRVGAPPVAGRVLFFGLIRDYKNAPALVHAFRGISRTDVSLHVVGKLDPAELGAHIESIVAGDPRIQLSFGYADDDLLVREFSEASVVALPYREMGNSGAMVLALSLGRPVLVPRTPANAAMADEVGPSWVRLYDGELTSAALEAAVREGVPSDAPNLSSRDWGTVGHAHIAAYRRALESRHDRRYSE
ncbi:glycosyltransferase [Salinibacterium hongtaonis]|uniref:GDP-mannose--glycolipid 4-beta-D-mannosyltransferase n=1 Tax=Homoserinimonas hongtaonis TaxID=2079791 RepID=A0A2U1T128_9MICO|nr:glycosyltransferase [Salinibacterium hongtaonis]PWB97570.1 GDP-mannose--glycolipid 4-beta-D-mannosyltransferase [Salinibacterium hongtaonis]